MFLINFVVKNTNLTHRDYRHNGSCHRSLGSQRFLMLSLVKLHKVFKIVGIYPHEAV